MAGGDNPFDQVGISIRHLAEACVALALKKVAERLEAQDAEFHNSEQLRAAIMEVAEEMIAPARES